jgi:ribosome-associated translation inhibitor RaiA
VDVVFHAHNAVISDRMKLRASRGLKKIAQRINRAVDAMVRFTQDGPTRRVEITLHASGHRNLIAAGESKFYGPALNTALSHLEAQAGHEKRASRRVNGRLARA